MSCNRMQWRKACMHWPGLDTYTVLVQDARSRSLPTGKDILKQMRSRHSDENSHPLFIVELVEDSSSDPKVSYPNFKSPFETIPSSMACPSWRYTSSFLWVSSTIFWFMRSLVLHRYQNMPHHTHFFQDNHMHHDPNPFLSARNTGANRNGHAWHPSSLHHIRA